MIFFPPRPHRSFRGFNLVEAAIVLGVVGLVIGGIWVAAATVTENRKRARFLEEILVVTQSIRQGFASTPASAEFYFGLVATPPTGVPKAAWGTYLPADMIDAATPAPVDPWGNVLYISVKPGTNSRIILFEMQSTTLATCSYLGPRIYAAIKSQLPASTTAATAVVTGADANDISTPPLAAQGCRDELDNEGTLSMSFAVTF